MNVPIEYLLPLAERISWAVLHSLWQGTLIALMLGPILRFLRGYSAAARHVACLVTLVCMMAAGLLTTVVVSPSVALRNEANLSGTTSFREPIEATARSTPA